MPENEQTQRIIRKTMSIFAVLFAIAVAISLFIIFIVLTPRDRSVIFSLPKTYIHHDTPRYYRITLPERVDSDTKLILGLHGFSDSARRFGYYTGLHNVAENAIVVYPEATRPTKPDIKTGWNAGFCCGSGFVNEVDDAGFLAELSKSLIQRYGLGNPQVFVTGFSNGGMMAQRLAAVHPELVRAVAVGSGAIGTRKSSIKPAEPTPILLMHGQQDKTVPLDGGTGNDPDFQWLSFADMQQTWEAVNEGSAAVETQLYENMGHQWHDWRILDIWNRNPEASQRAIDFFNQR